MHSASGIETKRSAFGTSGITDSNVLFVRNNLGAPAASIVENPDAWMIEIEPVANPDTDEVGAEDRPDGGRPDRRR